MAVKLNISHTFLLSEQRVKLGQLWNGFNTSQMTNCIILTCSTLNYNINAFEKLSLGQQWHIVPLSVKWLHSLTSSRVRAGGVGGWGGRWGEQGRLEQFSVFIPVVIYPIHISQQQKD